MATNFPASLDSLTNPTSSDSLNSPSHSAQHANSNDAIEALQAKVGVDGSAVTTSIDYQLNTGYRYHSTVYFTSSSTFTKASYPWLRAIRVKIVGGGGGGAAATRTSGSTGRNSRGGGGGGGYAEKWITDIAGLSASETVTVGAGGAGGVLSSTTSDTPVVGDAGGATSAFGLTGNGGSGGVISNNAGAAGGTASGGDINITGGRGGNSAENISNTEPNYALFQLVGSGGDSMLGFSRTEAVNNNAGARDGSGFGWGREGSNRSSASTGRNGSAGGDGVVIVELYA